MKKRDVQVILTGLLLVAGLWTGSAFAVDSAASGYWDEGATWSGSTVPTGTDDVTIKNGHTVTIRTNTVNNVNSLTIETNAVLTHEANSTAALGERYKVVVDVANDLTIDLGGEINVDEKGFAESQGPGWGSGFAGGSYGGKGGHRYGAANIDEIGPTYGSIIAPTNLGSGGDRGAGGGCVQLTVAGATTVNGIVSADGEPEQHYESGSGGSVFLTTGTLAGNGTIRANGGAAGYESTGGGGRVAVILTSSMDFGASTIQAHAGRADNNAWESGSGGTVYLEHTSHVAGQGRLVVDFDDGYHLVNTIQNELSPSTYAFSEIVLTNGAVYELDTNDILDVSSATVYGTPSDRAEGIYVNGGTLTVPAALTWSNYFIAIGSTGSTFTTTSITVETNATLKIDAPWTLDHSLTLAPGGWLSHTPNSTTALGERYKLDLTLNGNLNIQTGGMVNVDGMGYSKGQGPGEPPGYGGGSHGGTGGMRSGTFGPTYGSITSPTNIGSGGGSTAGGGSARLTVSGTTTVNGAISADGLPVSFDSGSGGSVFLTTGTLTGNGTIRANSGDVPSGGGGGGGRVAVVLTNSTDFGEVEIEALGIASHSQRGACGTVYLQTQAQETGEGLLIVDANNSAPQYTTLIGSNVTDTTVGTVVLRNLAVLELTNQTLTVNGSWSNAATFVAQSDSTVNLASTNAATVTADNAFYNLTAGAAGKTIRFEAGKTNTVNGTLTFLDGTALRSTLDGTQTYLNLATAGGTQVIGEVSVKDNNASPGQLLIADTGSSDLGNNDNWDFSLPEGTVLFIR